MTGGDATPSCDYEVLCSLAALLRLRRRTALRWTQYGGVKAKIERDLVATIPEPAPHVLIGLGWQLWLWLDGAARPTFTD